MLEVNPTPDDMIVLIVTTTSKDFKENTNFTLRDVSYMNCRAAAVIGNFQKKSEKNRKINTLTTFSIDSVTTRKFESK